VRRTFALSAALLLGSCSDDRPAAPTAEEIEQLDEVEAMLNSEASNEEGPAAQAADPSNRST
jgi:hypothetical protein